MMSQQQRRMMSQQQRSSASETDSLSEVQFDDVMTRLGFLLDDEPAAAASDALGTWVSRKKSPKNCSA